MKIKTWINNYVKGIVKKRWPNKVKGINCNYTDDSWHTQEKNRWIQIPTIINDSYIHYEIINNHIELHFEYSDEKDKGYTRYIDLVDFLQKETEHCNLYDWSFFQWNLSVKCVYQRKIEDYTFIEEILSEVITYFDPLIDVYLNKSIGQNQTTNIEVDESIKVPDNNVDLEEITLEGILKRKINIPDYQRIYCWEEQNVKCLLNDLLNHQDKFHIHNAPYILGTIILHYHDNKYDIIDGQQRLVTLSLLLYELGIDNSLLDLSFESAQAMKYISYNKFLIENFVRKHVANRVSFREFLLKNIKFSVLFLQNTSLDLAYNFFSNENSRGVPLSDYDLLKAHHLRFIPDDFEQQSRKAAETWNHMIMEGQKQITDSDPNPEYVRTLDTYLFNLRKWMRKSSTDTHKNDRHVKREYEAAPIMDELAPFGERFHYNEPIQGGTHFFSYVETHLSIYRQFITTKEYLALHTKMQGSKSLCLYIKAMETLLFAYFEKFNRNCLADALVLIMRYLLQNRYQTDRATKSYIHNDISDRGIVLMIERATSPTFFLAQMYNICRDFPVKYLQDMIGEQKYLRSVVMDIKNAVNDNVYIESIKNNIKL